MLLIRAISPSLKRLFPKEPGKPEFGSGIMVSFPEKPKSCSRCFDYLKILPLTEKVFAL